MKATRNFLSRIGRSHPVSDFALWAAGLTFFGVIAIVPLALESVALTGRVVGAARVRAGFDHVVEGVPDFHGTRQAILGLVNAGLELSWARQVALLFPMSLYGEGLRRAFLQLSFGRPTSTTGWRGRVAVLPVSAAGPVLVLFTVYLAPTVGPLYGAGGGRLVLGVLIAFHFTFLAVGTLLVLVYRGVGSVAVSKKAAMVGAFSAASFIAGFAQGFLVFLAIPIDWADLFGGLRAVGTMTALTLWLYVMHFLVLTGYRIALVMDERSKLVVRLETLHLGSSSP